MIEAPGGSSEGRRWSYGPTREHAWCVVCGHVVAAGEGVSASDGGSAHERCVQIIPDPAQPWQVRFLEEAFTCAHCARTASRGWVVVGQGQICLRCLGPVVAAFNDRHAAPRRS